MCCGCELLKAIAKIQIEDPFLSDGRLAALTPCTPPAQMSFLELVALADLSMSCHQGDLGSQCGGGPSVTGTLRQRNGYLSGTQDSQCAINKNIILGKHKFIYSSLWIQWEAGARNFLLATTPAQVT